MTCYPLTKTERTGKIMKPLQTMNSEEFIRDRYDLYLTDELIYNDDGKFKRRYRLHSKQAHRMEDYLAYDILCPKCSHRFGRSKWDNPCTWEWCVRPR